ncbi:hypothetical protein CE91St41_36820 [Oscillospiraceae bacterium]|nr:hypothetical protein CE91St40_36800 [Oscillospiraceae bacterium]BDF76793.1 hypothetical protein CE91St41_36820 [Oscillospiraceae bacterium]
MTDFGIFTDVSFVLVKASAAIVLSLLSSAKVTEVKFSAILNAPTPIDVTLLGIVTAVIALFP